MFAMRVRKLLMVAFLLLSAVTLSISADIAPAGGAQSTNSGSVTVTDSAIIPTSVTILAHGTVLWTNRGSRLHKIVSSHGAFNAFALTSAHSHRVLFSSPGVYPYTVDGVIKGAVIVLTGASPVNASPGPSSTPGRRSHLWKGTVKAIATYTTHVPCVMGSADCGTDGIARTGPYTGTYDGTLTLVEDSHGVITGQGRVSASGCKFPDPNRRPATYISFDITGTDNGKRLELQIILSSLRQDGFSCGFGYGWVVAPGASPSSALMPIYTITNPGYAEGPWHGRAEEPPSPIYSTASFRVDYEFSLFCASCPGAHFFGKISE